MNFKKSINFVKPVFLISILVISIVTQGLFIPTVDALHPVGKDSVTKSISAGTNTIFLRDISNLLNQTDAAGNSIATVTLDTSTAGSGFVTITVTDVDANMDMDGKDFVLASANSTTSGSAKTKTELEETGFNTGIFSGTVILSSLTTTESQIQVSAGDNMSVLYDPNPGVGRVEFKLSGTTGVGTVVMKDDYVTKTSELCNSGFVFVTHPVDILITGATATGVSVSIAATNEVGLAPASANSLKVLYKEPGTNWVSLTPVDEGPGHDNLSFFPLTGWVTNVDQPTPTNPGNFSGQYALGAVIGCPGGGGGGLVKAGLVVNALAGAGVLSKFFNPGGTGGGSGGPAAPVVTSGSVASLDGSGFIQQGIGGIVSGSDKKSLDTTQVVNTGEDLTFRFDMYENGGIGNFEHATMYFFTGNKVDLNKRFDVTQSDAYILFDRTQSVHVIDPNGYFENADFELLEKDTWNLVLKYDITFAKPIDTSSIVLRTWDSQKHTADKIFHDAIKVVGSGEITSIFETSPPVLNSESLVNSEPQEIPMWVKNNANWWHQKQIDDSDFVAGIEYLIQQNIINMPETVVSDSVSTDVPDWIRGVAGFWGESAISDAEFVQAIQWLITNGVIVVA